MTKAELQARLTTLADSADRVLANNGRGQPVGPVAAALLRAIEKATQGVTE